MRVLTILLIVYSGVCFAEPWGKDATLVKRNRAPTEVKGCETPFLGPVGERLISFHQVIISPADGPRSHFIPSSSQYTLEAMQKYGFFRGFIMGCDRLMRENSDPWVYQKTLDPVGNPMKWDPVK